MTTLTLKSPVTFGSEMITELHFQELKAKHIRTLPKDIGMSDILNLASTLTGVIPKVMDELSAEDTFRVVEMINGFFPHSLKITQEE